MARARILETAFSRMTAEKRKAVQKKVRETMETTGASKEESQLKAILDDSSEMAEMY